MVVIFWDDAWAGAHGRTWDQRPAEAHGNPLRPPHHGEAGGGVEAQERTKDPNIIKNAEDGIINQHRHRGSCTEADPTHGERRSQGNKTYELSRK